MSVHMADLVVLFQQNKRFGGNDMTTTDWKINIENTATSVAVKYGNEVVASAFRRYDATCLEDLSPVYYGEVFGDLMLIDEDG